MTDIALEKETSQPQKDRQVVIIHLGGEIYGVDIGAVHTVIKPQTITVLPKSPAAVRGVLNLRGRVLPVIDLRTRFGLPPLDAAEAGRCRIVIVETTGVMAGLIVDGVSEVLHLPASAIDAPSTLVVGSGTECITGIGRVPAGQRQGDMQQKAGAGQERLIIRLDIDRILSPVDGAAFANLARAA